MGNQNSQPEAMKNLQRYEIRPISQNKQKLSANKANQKSQKQIVKVRQHQNKFLNCFINHEIPQQSVKLIQFLLNFLSIKEALQFRLINKETKFIVEMSNNIYANYLSQLFIRKMQISHFIEYGADIRFQQTLNEQILSIELSQDECWLRMYKSYRFCLFKINEFTKNLQQSINFKEIITESLLDPLLPVAILTDDALKCSTSSWFQLYMAQNYEDVNCNIEADQQLNEVIEKLYQNCQIQFSSENFEQAQLLFEIRWAIIDNFIKDPTTINNNMPELLKLGSYILHLIYLRCIFAKRVLQVIQSTNIDTSLLNFYIILWRTFMGSVWRLNIYFEDLFKYINLIFQKNYKTSIPPYNLATISGRIWAQIVLADSNNKENNSVITLEESLLLGYRKLLNEKRDQILEIFVQDRPEKFDIKNLKYHDKYFRYMPNAINCLLGHFSSSLVDISMQEQSINWIGHSNSQIGEPFSILQKDLISDTQVHYQNAAILFGSNSSQLLEYIQADSKFLQEIVNRWTVQNKIFPIGITYLYNNIEMAIQQLDNNSTLKVRRTKSSQDSQVNTPGLLNSSAQLTQQQMDLFTQFLEQNLQSILDQQGIITPNQTQLPGLGLQSRYSNLARYSKSNYKTQTSQFEQLNQNNGDKKIKLVQNIQKVQDLEKENLLMINIRDYKINQRNSDRKISSHIDQDLYALLSFKTAPQIEKIMSYFELKNEQKETQLQFLQTFNPTSQFIELQQDGVDLMQELKQLDLQMQ